MSTFQLFSFGNTESFILLCNLHIKYEDKTIYVTQVNFAQKRDILILKKSIMTNS